MKRITNLSIIAGLSVLATAACTKTEKVAETVQGGAILTIEASAPQVNQPETKVTLNPADLIKWSSSDKSYAGLFLPDNGIIQSDVSATTISSDGSDASFQFSSKSIYFSASEAARVLYPCSSEASGASSFSFRIPEIQTLSSKAGSVTTTNVPMISDAVSVKSSVSGTEYSPSYDSNVIKAKMHILSSIIAFYVYDSKGIYSDEKVKSIELHSSSSKISEPEPISLNLDGSLPLLEGTSRTAGVQFSYSFYQYSLAGIISKELSSPIYMSIIPGQFAGDVTVKTDKATYVFPFENPKTFARAEVKDFSLNLSNEKAVRSVPTSITVTNVGRTQVPDGCKVTLTVKLSDNANGFYAYVGASQKTTASSMLSADKYIVGQEDDDKFSLNADGTVNYNCVVSQKFTFSVLPFDANDVVGVGQRLGENEDYWSGETYPRTYSNTNYTDVKNIEGDIVPFNN